jgi:hypothetical protein
MDRGYRSREGRDPLHLKHFSSFIYTHLHTFLPLLPPHFDFSIPTLLQHITLYAQPQLITTHSYLTPLLFINHFL